MSVELPAMDSVSWPEICPCHLLCLNCNSASCCTFGPFLRWSRLPPSCNGALAPRLRGDSSVGPVSDSISEVVSGLYLELVWVFLQQTNQNVIKMDDYHNGIDSGDSRRRRLRLSSRDMGRPGNIFSNERK
jgi:hypothetical protein